MQKNVLILFLIGFLSLPAFAQHHLLSSRVDSLQTSADKAAFLENLYYLDELAKMQRDSLQWMPEESLLEKQARSARADKIDSLNYSLVDRYIKRFGYTSDSTWSNHANQALFRIINRSLETRFRLKHFPELKKAYYAGKIAQPEMVTYLCKTIHDSKKRQDEGCESRDLDKLFNKVRKMYDRYYWWE